MSYSFLMNGILVTKCLFRSLLVLLICGVLIRQLPFPRFIGTVM